LINSLRVFSPILSANTALFAATQYTGMLLWEVQEKKQHRLRCAGVFTEVLLTGRG